MENCLRQWSEHTLSGVRSRSCRAIQQQLVPDVRSAAECVLLSLACTATFVATSDVLHKAPSSTNVIVDVDGLLQASKHRFRGVFYVLVLFPKPEDMPTSYTSYRRAAATICPRPDLQRKRAGAALSQAGRAGLDPISQHALSSRPAAHAARRPDVRDRRQTDVRQTDVRQHHRLMPLGGGIIRLEHLPLTLRQLSRCL